MLEYCSIKPHSPALEQFVHSEVRWLRCHSRCTTTMTRLLESSVYNTRGSNDCISFALKLFSTMMRIVFRVSFSWSPANNLLTNRSICWNRCWLSGSARAAGAASREEGFATPKEEAVCLTRFVWVLSPDFLVMGAARWIHIHREMCRHKSMNRIAHKDPKLSVHNHIRINSGYA